MSVTRTATPPRSGQPLWPFRGGKGTFDVTPGATITWDPNNVWPANYTASLQYNIVSGP